MSRPSPPAAPRCGLARRSFVGGSLRVRSGASRREATNIRVPARGCVMPPRVLPGRPIAAPAPDPRRPDCLSRKQSGSYRPTRSDGREGTTDSRLLRSSDVPDHLGSGTPPWPITAARRKQVRRRPLRGPPWPPHISQPGGRPRVRLWYRSVGLARKHSSAICGRRPARHIGEACLLQKESELCDGPALSGR